MKSFDEKDYRSRMKISQHHAEEIQFASAPASSGFFYDSHFPSCFESNCLDSRDFGPKTGSYLPITEVRLSGDSEVKKFI